jgi:hypothetical protein
MTSARHLRAVDAVPRYGIVVRVSQVMGRAGESFHTQQRRKPPPAKPWRLRAA